MSGVVVGRTELENRDPARQIARGAFRPGLGYELAQPVFDLYEAARRDAAGLDRYRRAREALQLRLTDAGGSNVGFRELHIRRADDATADSKEYVIEVVTDDPRLWSASKH
jgi:hypothetical protein